MIIFFFFFTTYSYIGLQFSDFFFSWEAISYRCLAQITENLTNSTYGCFFVVFVIIVVVLFSFLTCLQICRAVMAVKIWGSLCFYARIFSSWGFLSQWSQNGYHTFNSHLFKVGITQKGFSSFAFYLWKEVFPHCFLLMGQP